MSRTLLYPLFFTCLTIILSVTSCKKKEYPVAKFNSSYDESTNTLSIIIDGSNNEAADYNIDWGDGSPDEKVSVTNTKTLTHVYNAPAPILYETQSVVYRVTLTVESSEGLESYYSEPVAIFVDELPPIPSSTLTYTITGTSTSTYTASPIYSNNGGNYLLIDENSGVLDCILRVPKQIGTFYSSSSSGSTGSYLMIDNNPDYWTSYTLDGYATITVTNLTTSQMTGTFSGNVKKDNGGGSSGSYLISNGSFTIYF
jgi:hypothetical protein